MNPITMGTVPLSVQQREQTVPLGVEQARQPVPLGVSPGGGGGTRDYDKLTNKPSLNGITIEGDHDSAYYGIDQTYTHTQAVASAEWTISHNLNKRPSVTVVDSAGTVVVGDVQYIDDNTVTITFIGAFSGAAYLN